MRAVLSIGSNLADRHALLRTVVEEFAEELVAASSIYATAPWGVTEQGEFLNAVLIVEVANTPLELLRRGQALEAAAQRVREYKWGPRTLDVDIVDIAGYTSQDPELIVPHPYAAERAFVLVPWLEADPHASLGGRPLDDLLASLDTSEILKVGPLT